MHRQPLRAHHKPDRLRHTTDLPARRRRRGRRPPSSRKTDSSVDYGWGADGAGAAAGRLGRRAADDDGAGMPSLRPELAAAGKRGITLALGAGWADAIGAGAAAGAGGAAIALGAALAAGESAPLGGASVG
jgi:hypothetical protein